MIRKIALLILVSAIASAGMQYTDANAHRGGQTLYEVHGTGLILLSGVLVGLAGVLVLARVFSTNEISQQPSH